MRPKSSTGRTLPCRILSLLLITALGSAFLGCAGRSVVPSLPPGGGIYLSADDALRALETSGPGDRTLTVTARIEINAQGERRPLKAALMMRRPARLRMETVPPLGPPDFFLSVDTGELRVFSPGNNGGSFYMGRATARNFNRFFPLPLPAADMISLLMGQPPGMGETSSCGEQWEEGLYRIDRCAAGEKTLSLWIDPVGGLLLRVRAFEEGGRLAHAAEFADHTSVKQCILPQRLTIRGEAVSLTVRYTEVRLDNDTGLFALPIPEGIVPISLD
jgi:hypothetical protein